MALLNIPAGDPAATKVYSPFLWSSIESDMGFMKMNSNPPPKISDIKQATQNNPGAPIVTCFDLGKGISDTILFSLVNIFEGQPVMGDSVLTGKFMSTTQSQQQVRIDQSRFGVESTRMAGYRTPHDLRKIGLNGLAAIAARLENQRCLAHLAGARGSQVFADWSLPLQSSPDFASIMVNPILAPTKNRQFYAAGQTSLGNLSATSVLSLSDVGMLGAMLRESVIPMRAAEFDADMWAANKPLYVLWVTNRQWEIMKRPSAAVSWTSAVTNAMKRFDGVKGHPLFMGEGIVWNGILVKPMDRYAIRFNPGDSVVVDSGGADGNTYTETTQTVPSIGASGGNVDRAILVGASALMKAYGSGGDGASLAWKYFETKSDHDNRLEQSMGMVEGCSKVRFKIKGVDTDYGVAVIDSYAPALNTSDFQAAMQLP